jgi:hypothetical protein
MVTWQLIFPEGGGLTKRRGYRRKQQKVEGTRNTELATSPSLFPVDDLKNDVTVCSAKFLRVRLETRDFQRLFFSFFLILPRTVIWPQACGIPCVLSVKYWRKWQWYIVMLSDDQMMINYILQSDKHLWKEIYKIQIIFVIVIYFPV